MAAAVLEARSIVKAFGRNRVLKGVDLSVIAGDTYVLFGPNGAGKTTLLKILSGLMKADSGDVLVFGEEFGEDPRGIKARIGVLSHEPYLYDELSARENLDFFGRLYDVPHRRERVRYMLKEVGLYARSHDRVGTFSRGMRQRLGLARALLHDPDLVLLDEPYTGLDVGATETLDDIIRDKAKEGKAFLAITHDLEHGLEMASRAGILDGGKLVLEAESSDWEGLRSRYREAMGGER
jgi:heme ABC exporter ATP-binding subunit CcmA